MALITISGEAKDVLFAKGALLGGSAALGASIGLVGGGVVEYILRRFEHKSLRKGQRLEIISTPNGIRVVGIIAGATMSTAAFLGTLKLGAVSTLLVASAGVTWTLVLLGGLAFAIYKCFKVGQTTEVPPVWNQEMKDQAVTFEALNRQASWLVELVNSSSFDPQKDAMIAFNYLKQEAKTGAILSREEIQKAFDALDEYESDVLKLSAEEVLQHAKRRSDFIFNLYHGKANKELVCGYNPVSFNTPRMLQHPPNTPPTSPQSSQARVTTPPRRPFSIPNSPPPFAVQPISPISPTTLNTFISLDIVSSLSPIECIKRISE